MPDEKPTLHLEGLVLEAEVKQGGTPPKEFRKVKMGNLWLSCWTPALYPLMVKGKYLAIDYITSQRGAFTNYNIQEAVEIAAPKPGAESVSMPTDSRVAGVAMRFAVDLVVAGKVELEKLESVAQRIYRAMETLHTGAAAHTTEATPNSPTEPISKTPKAATLDSEPKDSPFPEASSAARPLPEIPKFPNKGAFLTWAYKAYGKTSSELQAEFEKHGQACTFDQKAAEMLIDWWGVAPPKP